MKLEDLFSPEEISSRRQALLFRLILLGEESSSLSECALHIGHKLNGAGGTLGLKELASLGRELEQQARDGSATDEILASVMEHMQNELAAIKGSSGVKAAVKEAVAAPVGPAKVLCVDDTPESLAVMCALMRRLKVDVLRARNGQEALDIVSKTSPDLVLMDRMMPGISGDDACKEMRAQGHAFPIFAVTAMVGSYEELEAPYSGLIEKPLDMMAVMNTVKELLAEKGFANSI